MAFARAVGATHARITSTRAPPDFGAILQPVLVSHAAAMLGIDRAVRDLRVGQSVQVEAGTVAVVGHDPGRRRGDARVGGSTASNALAAVRQSRRPGSV